MDGWYFDIMDGRSKIFWLRKRVTSAGGVLASETLVASLQIG